MEKNELKPQGLAFGRKLQRAYRIVALYTAEHTAAEEPLQRVYESLNSLLKQTPQFTFGFFNRRVVLNELLTPDPSLDPLEDEFFKRGITAVTFFLGITFREFKRGMGLISTKPDLIEQSGGITAFLKKNAVEGMRIVAPETKPSKSGDAVLGMGFQSYMMSHSMLDTQQGVQSHGLQMLLQSAGMTSPEGFRGTPAEMLDLVGKATQAAWTNPEADPKETIQALAHLLEELSPGTLIAALPASRQSHLMGRPAHEVATELAEDMAVEWAKRRWGTSGDEEGVKVVAEDEVVEVLSRALQTTEVAERLLQKLSMLVEAGELPARITDRISQEMRWASYTIAQRHAHLMGLKWFNEQDFRHLVEFIKSAGKEGYLDKATEAAQHFLDCLDTAGAEARSMGLARLQDLIQILTGLHRLDFVRAVVERFIRELSVGASENPAQHQQVADCLAAAAQSLAMFEELETALQIGSELERSVASDPQHHQTCCGHALEKLLSPATIERLIELSLQKRADLTTARNAAALLRLVSLQAAEVVFRMLEEERSGSGRSRLLHVARQLGQGAFLAARRRLEDERWYVVRNACYVLGALSDPDLAAHLASVLRHPDARVQQAAATAIVRSNVPRRGVTLVEALPALPAHLQEMVLDELLLLKDPGVVDPLESFLLQPGGKMGLLGKAVRVLAALQDDRAAEVLYNVLRHGELALPLRRAALDALKSSSATAASQRLAAFRRLAPGDPLASE